MAIDPNIALQASQGPNLLQTLAGATQLKGQIAQQRANVAASQAYKDATDPVTGQINYGALTAALAQGAAAYNLPQIQAQVNEARNSALNYDKGQLELAGKRNDYLSGGFGGLLASGNISPGSVMAIATQGIKQGLFTPEDVISFTSDMPTDPGQLGAWAKQKYVGFSQNADRLKTLLPTTQTINTGAQQVMMSIDPTTGQPVQGGQQTVFNNQLTPGEQTANVQVYDPTTGTMRIITKAQQLGMSGQGGQPTGDLGSGRIQPDSGAALGTPQGTLGLQIAPAIGSQAAAETLAKGSADNVLALQAQADAAPQAIYQLQNMRTALKDFTPGPTADWASQAKALALQVSPDIAKKFGGIDPQNVASQEEFHKYATNLAQGMSQTLGAGSDAKLASAVAGNPNTSLTKLGNEQIIQVLIANQRALQAKNLAFQNSGLPPEKFNQFSSDFNKQIDPRVFAAQDMDRDHMTKMMNGLSPREQEAFKKSYNLARYNGLIQ